MVGALREADGSMTTTPDPRPRAIRGTTGGAADGLAGGTATIAGRRCTACSLATLSDAPSCPACGGEQTDATFGPRGTVWSSTVVRVPIPGRTPPYVLAYVDLLDGPRVFCHLDGHTERVPVGTSVELVGHNDHGDLTALTVHDRNENTTPEQHGATP